jgi:SAM-dependent methyltransferase
MDAFVSLLRRGLERRGIDPVNLEWLELTPADARPLSLHASRFELPVDSTPKLPFRQGSFDLVTAVSVHSSMSAERQRLLAAEIFRILRPGGLACFAGQKLLNPFAELDAYWRMRSQIRSVGFRKLDRQFLHSTMNYVLFCSRPHARRIRRSFQPVGQLAFSPI